MHRSGKNVSFGSAVSMGIGAMVGAGIFALLGEAGAIAGSAMWISFLISGGIALLSGYSLGRLGARYPGAGGIVEYLIQGYGVGRFSGAMSVMMYVSAIVAVSLVARSFGTYAHALIGLTSPPWLVEVFAAMIVLGFMLINLDGARSMTRLENVIVLVKMIVLVGFAIVGIIFMSPERLSPATYPPPLAIFYSVAVTFFAYEGFRVVTNAAEDMPDPSRTLPRAIMTAIALVMLVYVAIAISVFGNLSTDRVVASKEFALAEAAKPIFGEAGFKVVAVSALLATASAINASLYAATNVTYRLAKLGELPGALAEPIGHSREGLIVSSAIIIVLAVSLDLSSIASIGAISMLIIHLVVHIGHLRLLRETQANAFLVLFAAMTSAATIILCSYSLAQRSPMLLLWIAGFLVLAFAVEISLKLVTDRTVQARSDGGE